MFRVLAVCLLALASAQAMTTTHKPHNSHNTHKHHTGTHAHHTKVTHEPSETDNVKFYYDSFSHQMVLVNSHTCYIFTISDAEQHAVHTDVGIRTMELKLLNMLSSGMKTAVTDMTTLDKHVHHACGGHVQNYYMVAN